MGKLSLAAFDYRQGDGRAPFVQASQAMETKEWQSVVSLAKESVKRDPDNLEAWWLLGRGQVYLEKDEEALRSLSQAMAGDFQRYGALAKEAEWLEPFRKRAAGPHLLALQTHYQKEFQTLLDSSIPVVARKSSSHSEIYAYHPLSERFLRLSRTDGNLKGFVRDSKGRLATLSYKDTGEPQLLWIAKDGTLGEPLRLPEAKTLELYFDAGNVLHLTVNGSGGAQTFRVEADRLISAKPGKPASAILSSDGKDATLRQADVEAVLADWDQDGTTGAFRLASTQKTITVPEGATALRDSFAWSPGRRFVSFSTRPRAECGPSPEDRRATLFVAEAATGTLTPMVIGDGPFVARWLSDEQLAFDAYTALGQEVHVLAAPQNSVLARLKSPGGVGLSTTPRENRCPVTPEAAGEKTP